MFLDVKYGRGKEKGWRFAWRNICARCIPALCFPLAIQLWLNNMHVKVRRASPNQLSFPGHLRLFPACLGLVSFALILIKGYGNLTRLYLSFTSSWVRAQVFHIFEKEFGPEIVMTCYIIVHSWIHLCNISTSLLPKEIHRHFKVKTENRVSRRCSFFYA